MGKLSFYVKTGIITLLLIAGFVLCLINLVDEVKKIDFREEVVNLGREIKSIAEDINSDSTATDTSKAHD